MPPCSTFDLTVFSIEWRAESSLSQKEKIPEHVKVSS